MAVGSSMKIKLTSSFIQILYLHTYIIINGKYILTRYILVVLTVRLYDTGYIYQFLLMRKIVVSFSFRK